MPLLLNNKANSSTMTRQTPPVAKYHANQLLLKLYTKTRKHWHGNTCGHFSLSERTQARGLFSSKSRTILAHQAAPKHCPSSKQPKFTPKIHPLILFHKSEIHLTRVHTYHTQDFYRSQASELRITLAGEKKSESRASR